MKKRLFLAGIATAALLSACGSSSDNDEVFADDPFAAPPPVADTQGACPDVGNLTVTEITAGQCAVGGVLDQSATLTADTMWFIEESIQIGNSQFASTLTIEAGTQIRGAGTDHILVWPGSTILANGTGANPIQMLSLIHISEPTRPY